MLVLFASMAVAGFTVDGLFGLLHLIPTGPRPPSAVSHARFAWDGTTWLDIAAVAGTLAFVHSRRLLAAHDDHEDHCAHDDHPVRVH